MEFQFLKLSRSLVVIMIAAFVMSNVYADDDHKDEHKEKHESGEEHKGSHSEDGEHADEKKSEHGDHDHGHEESSSKFGPGKAIVAVRDEGKSFQLSEESSKFLGLVFSHLTEIKNPKSDKESKIFEIPLRALVSFQAEHGLYIRDEAWIELVEVKVVKRFPDKVWITSKELNAEMEMAVQGTAFLRAAHLDASGQGGEGHAH